ncbi:MAG TPA: apolipoprotein N-acyltransferase [Terriglobales bacterium]|jgi:apolipoprotein N-acyltransferase
MLVLLSTVLQILIFPLPNLYFLSWIALAPLLVALLRAREPDTLQLSDGARLLPARPLQGFVMAYVSGIVWYAGTCYWVFSTMKQYGGAGAPAAFGITLLFCLYVGLYHGAFGLLLGLISGAANVRRALVAAPFLWVALEFARTRITGFPWDLLGIAQVDNVPLARVASVTGVYGISLEIFIVNVAFAAAFLVPRARRKPLLLASVLAATVLQAGQWVPIAPAEADRTALLVQANIPILQSADWTSDYFNTTLQDLTWISVNPPGGRPHNLDLVVWPEAPAPFEVDDPRFRQTAAGVAQQSRAWLLAGSLGANVTARPSQRVAETYNSAALFNPAGELSARYDKIHLVPFGEYVPFRRIFFFASGLTEQVGDFSRGASRAPLTAGDEKLGVFICYESIFPDEVRQLALNGAQVFVNISNDGWYGDSGAYAQHLKQARMRAVENARWLLRDTNTGVTAAIDPYGRIAAVVPRKLRTVLKAPYARTGRTTFYTRHGDWLAYVCAIISLGALLMRLLKQRSAGVPPAVAGSSGPRISG